MASIDFDGDHINLNCIKPIDKESIIKSAVKTGRVITVEDNIVSGGMGDVVSDLLKELKIPVTKLGINDRFVTHGSVPELLKELRLDKDAIKKVIEE